MSTGLNTPPKKGQHLTFLRGNLNRLQSFAPQKRHQERRCTFQGSTLKNSQISSGNKCPREITVIHIHQDSNVFSNYFLIIITTFSLDGGRISLNREDPHRCMVTFRNAKKTDSGTWNIRTTLCSRGRGKNSGQAIVYFYNGRIQSLQTLIATYDIYMSIILNFTIAFTSQFIYKQMLMEDGPIGARMVIVVFLVAQDKKSEADHARHRNHREMAPIVSEIHS